MTARNWVIYANPFQWSKDNEYEAMVIVGHNGNEYASLKDVPKGIDIKDEGYWVLTKIND